MSNKTKCSEHQKHRMCKNFMTTGGVDPTFGTGVEYVFGPATFSLASNVKLQTYYNC